MVKPTVPRAYLFTIGLFVAVGAVVLLLTDKRALHITINGLWTPSLDALAPWVTTLGDGLVPTVVSLGLLLFHSPRFGLLAGVSALLNLAATQLLKHTLFADAVRPLVFFGNSYSLHFVPGVQMYSYNGFPSGHAATAVALCFILAMYTRRQWLQVLLAILGLLVAFSRVYLSQHFFGDVYAGGIMGLILALATVFAFEKWIGHDVLWMDRPLLRFARTGKSTDH